MPRRLRRGHDKMRRVRLSVLVPEPPAMRSASLEYGWHRWPGSRHSVQLVCCRTAVSLVQWRQTRAFNWRQTRVHAFTYTVSQCCGPSSDRIPKKPSASTVFEYTTHKRRACTILFLFSCVKQFARVCLCFLILHCSYRLFAQLCYSWPNCNSFLCCWIS